ncbi:hypothetical protein WJX81_000014 [Elliptochloris bilobata]|uniref:Uncharacterized protein n=1 Tax=Elliptochloris bilobata TaxID=381761 RepID=A0AAW1S1D9_9CHLO
MDNRAFCVALVTGASRGLGLEFARQLLSRPGQSVVAACRDPSSAGDLQQLAGCHPDRLMIVPMDVADEQSIQSASEAVARRHGHLNTLLNVAGVLHIPDVLAPETALSRVTYNNLLLNFQVNAFGPVLVTKAFAPLLAKTSAASASSQRPAIVANLSARVGSISDNELGGWYSYRASKSAQNQLSKCMSLEFARRRQQICVVMLHPGTCDTDLSQPFQKNVAPGKLFSRERAVQQLLGVVDALTMADTGRYIAWDGSDIPF